MSGSRTMLSDRTLQYAEDLTRALLGADALYVREQAGNTPPAAPGSTEAAMRERLVVLNMSTTHQPEPFTSYSEARARFTALMHAAEALPEPDRRQYYRQCCQSTIAFTHWREGNLPFTGQIADFLHVPAAPATDAELDTLRAAMRALLTTMGYTGDLAAQFATWEARHRVPPDAVPGVLDELMDEAWERTAARMELPAPQSDGMRVVTESGAPYNARCDYLNRTVHLNIDPILTRPALKHLAVHECYPGHYVQFSLREAWYHRGLAPADGLLSVVNTASSCTFEGIADNGMAVLDWLDNDDDRLSALMTRYRAGIGTGAAWRLHALGQSGDAVRNWLRSQTLVGGEGWVANRMRFIAAPHRCALIWSYWRGEPSVAPVWERTPPAQRGDFLRFLYARMHSPQSVAFFG
jgi:hypothetical protein